MRRIVVLLAIVIALVGLAPQQSFAQSAPALVRLMHASPDAPNMDVYIDGEATLNNVPFYTLSTYMEVPAGSHRIQLVPSGNTLDKAVISINTDLIRGRSYTIAAVNRFATIRALVLKDNAMLPPAGQAMVRIIHAAPDVAAVDIKLADSDTPFLTDQFFGSADYATLPAGNQTLEVARNNTANVFFISPELRLESGWTYTLVLTGEGLAAPGFSIQASVDRTGT